MSMKFEDIMVTYYADFFNQGLFGMQQVDGLVEIQNWVVPDVPQPTRNEVYALATPELEHKFNCNEFFKKFTPYIQHFMDSTAVFRGYGSALSCISYMTSSVQSWSSDAGVFNSWRDICWTYIMQQKTLIENGTRPIPDNLDILKNELPAIVWPN